MPTITDITDWTEVRIGDEVLYDGSLVHVDDISIQPEENHPEFLIAYVDGRHAEDGGRHPGRKTRMTPNARSLIAVRREVPAPAPDSESAVAVETAETDLGSGCDGLPRVPLGGVADAGFDAAGGAW